MQFVETDLDRLGRRGAVEAMRGFLRASAEGQALSPPRAAFHLGARRMVFTVGADVAAGVMGFRLYSLAKDAEPGPGPSQVLGLLDLHTGQVLATAVGDAFGAWRTAALGAVAFEEAVRGRGRVDVAALGCGRQAWHALRTWAALDLVARVRVCARHLDEARAFAAELSRDTGLEVVPVASPKEAVSGAQAVLCATPSLTPIFDAADLALDAFVASLGPKCGRGAEVPAGVYAKASFLFTDAPSQLLELEASRGCLPGGRHASEVHPLSDVVAGQTPMPSGGLRLFLAEGLPGTEVALLEALRRTYPECVGAARPSPAPA